MRVAFITVLLASAVVMLAAGAAPRQATAEIPALIPAAHRTLPAHIRAAGPMAEMAYQAAIDHPQVVESVPCLCGCIESLGHQSNLDCYIEQKEVGGVTVYSSHGLYCGVCQLITRDALDGAARGMTSSELQSMIVDRYGS
ncbi:MAG TPA: PCYCGC motif-containing (lipo)protein [Thermomicrobiales bacterium]|nr:PCYCGC motif-containing (lipo)protein [Thermomicrobiales bacterium]